MENRQKRTAIDDATDDADDADDVDRQRWWDKTRRQVTECQI